MRNLIVCCDGTWNTPEQEKDGIPAPTNVVRLYNALADVSPQNVEQIKYYHPGVGTEGNWWDKLMGGGTGIGLSKNVMSAYKWLAQTYQREDRIFLFGFSRGAYTVRSLAGFIASCGLLDLSQLGPEDVWKRVEAAYTKGYRKRKERSDWAKDWAFHHSAASDGEVEIFFLGVWDTVGALGIPNDLAILNLLDDADRYAFHDTTLNQRILNARHAVALDESRASFAPALWRGIQGRPNVRQVWFPGVHSDVGGGYVEKGLSDGALKWMMDEVRSLGLGLHEGMYLQVQPNFQDVLHDSRRGLFKYLRTHPRCVPKIAEDNEGSQVHESAVRRQANPPITQAPYRPTYVLQPGKQKQFSIYAAQPWNETGLFLEAGVEYEFAASGQWLDRKITCGPEGASDGKFQMGEVAHLAGSLLGHFEKIFKRLTKNEEADFRGTKRIEDEPWFALIGVIANGGNPDAAGVPEPCEIIAIGKGRSYRVAESGYFYCFANDAWNFYDNNRGSVSLTVTRRA